MKKFVALLMAALTALTLFSGCASNQEQKVLNVLTWDGYIPEDVLNDFQQSTGIKINFSNFESNEEMLAKLEATQGGDYDLVIGSDYILKQAISENLIQELDKSKIPNFENLDPAFLNQYYDPESKYTVPYSAGTPLIIYDPEKLGMEITSYNDLWSPQLQRKKYHRHRFKIHGGIHEYH